MPALDPWSPGDSFSSADIWQDVVAGHRSIIVIDDTRASTPDSERRVGIAIPVEKVATVHNSMVDLCLTLGRETIDEVDEIHCRELTHTDNSRYDPLTWERRLQILHRLAHILHDNDLTVRHAEVDDVFAQLFYLPLPYRGDPGRSPQAERMLRSEMRLAAQLARDCGNDALITGYLASGPSRSRGQCLSEVVDHLSGERTYPLLGYLDPPGLVIETAGIFPLLQLADFAAWSFNRLSTIMQSPDPTPGAMSNTNRRILTAIRLAVPQFRDIDQEALLPYVQKTREDY